MSTLYWRVTHVANARRMQTAMNVQRDSQFSSSYLIHDRDCQDPNDKIITNRDYVPSLACSFVLRYLSFLRSSFVDQNVTTEFRHRCWYLIEIVIGSICRNGIYESDDRVVLIQIFACPTKNQLLGTGVPEPRRTYRN